MRKRRILGINTRLIIMIMAVVIVGTGTGCGKKDSSNLDETTQETEEVTYAKSDEDKDFGMSIDETKAPTPEEIEQKRFVEYLTSKGYSIEENVYLEDKYTEIERSRQFKEESITDKSHLVTLAVNDEHKVVCMKFPFNDESRILSYKDFIIGNANSNCKEQNREVFGESDIKYCRAKSKEFGKLDVYTVINKGNVYLIFQDQKKDKEYINDFFKNYIGIENGEIKFSN